MQLDTAAIIVAPVLASIGMYWLIFRHHGSNWEKVRLIVMTTGDFDKSTGELTGVGEDQVLDTGDLMRDRIGSPAVVLVPDPEVPPLQLPCYAQTSELIAKHLDLNSDHGMKVYTQPHTIMRQLADPSVHEVAPNTILSVIWRFRHTRDPLAVVLVLDDDSFNECLEAYSGPAAETGLAGQHVARAQEMVVSFDVKTGKIDDHSRRRVWTSHPRR